jgi:hypothetical protein
MPLQFESISHGQIAFGFFNIETDMILLNRYFFFANDFCHHIVQFSENDKETYEATWEVYSIEKATDIGNLTGAIHGTDHKGFIGEVYTLLPFPAKREAFKQNTEGFKNRAITEKMIQKYAKRTYISFFAGQKKDKISIGQYVFNKTVFQELVQYIWAGGYPRWKDEIRPDYVLAMKKKIEQSKSPLLNGLLLD